MRSRSRRGSGEQGRWQGPPEEFEGPFSGRGGHRRGGFGPRGPRRARRGDVRGAALALLHERPMHGYEMIQELEQRTDGMWRPSPGAVYPALQHLEDQGLVTVDASGGKRLFSLTDAGRAEAADAAERKPWDEVTKGVNPLHLQLIKAMGQAAAATRQIAQEGSDAQQTAAADILNETRRRLYAILAEA